MAITAAVAVDAPWSAAVSRLAATRRRARLLASRSRRSPSRRSCCSRDWHRGVFGHDLLLGGTGLPDTFASRRGLPAADLLLLHPGGPALPPLLVWAPIVALAVLGLVTSRRAARVAWFVLRRGGRQRGASSRGSPRPGSVPDARYWAGAPLLVAARAR